MLKSIPLLSGLLVFQVILVALFSLGGSSLEAYKSDRKLLELHFADLNKVQIEVPEKEVIILEKNAEKWILPNASNFPVSSEKLESLVNNLFEMQRPFPVGSTKSAAKKLQVADNDFQKKVTFFKEKEEVALLLGTSPNFKRIHARVSGEDEIYAINLNTYDIPNEDKAWYDPNALNFNLETIKAFQVSELEVKKEGGNYSISSEVPEGKELNQAETSSLFSKVAKVRFSDVLKDFSKKDFDKLSKIVTYQVVTNTEAININVRGPYKDNFYVLFQSNLPFYFKVTKERFDYFKKLIGF